MARINTSELRLIDNLHFVARTGSGHEIDIASGGTDADVAPSPVELVLSAGGACMAMDALSILRKMREEISSYEVHAEGTRAAEHPRVLTSITMVHSVRGRAVREENVARALQLSMTRYCPIYAMLSPTVPITVRYEITDEVTGAVVIGEAEREAEEASPLTA